MGAGMKQRLCPSETPTQGSELGASKTKKQRKPPLEEKTVIAADS